jgi:hypothetical protein
VLSGEGTPLEIPFGGTVTIKAHTSNTSGSMSVLEFVHPPKAGPALHSMDCLTRLPARHPQPKPGNQLRDPLGHQHHSMPGAHSRGPLGIH